MNPEPLHHSPLFGPNLVESLQYPSDLQNCLGNGTVTLRIASDESRRVVNYPPLHGDGIRAAGIV